MSFRLQRKVIFKFHDVSCKVYLNRPAEICGRLESLKGTMNRYYIKAWIFGWRILCDAGGSFYSFLGTIMQHWMLLLHKWFWLLSRKLAANWRPSQCAKIINDDGLFIKVDSHGYCTESCLFLVIIYLYYTVYGALWCIFRICMVLAGIPKSTNDTPDQMSTPSHRPSWYFPSKVDFLVLCFSSRLVA